MLLDRKDPARSTTHKRQRRRKAPFREDNQPVPRPQLRGGGAVGGHEPGVALVEPPASGVTRGVDPGLRRLLHRLRLMVRMLRQDCLPPQRLDTRLRPRGSELLGPRSRPASSGSRHLHSRRTCFQQGSGDSTSSSGRGVLETVRAGSPRRRATHPGSRSNEYPSRTRRSPQRGPQAVPGSFSRCATRSSLIHGGGSAAVDPSRLLVADHDALDFCC